MSKIAKAIGALVITLVLFGIPVLFALSIVFGWNRFAVLVFALITSVILALVWSFVLCEVDDEQP